jgi:putative transposase
MILSEEHRIKKHSNAELLREIDEYCYKVKNLSNSVNYLIKQCYRIHKKIVNGKALEDWEKDLIQEINKALAEYNVGRSEVKRLHYIDADNGYIADAYFLSWYLKGTEVYKDVPYSTCSQICIQEKCREWKSFYRATAEYGKNPKKFKEHPHAPGYLDPKTGRGSLVITSQNFKVDEDGKVTMPKFLSDIHIRARHGCVRQIRIKMFKDSVLISLMYEKEEKQICGTKVMGIDLGVNNLIAAAWDSEDRPVIINGKPIKSINQYYNKAKAHLQKEAKVYNGKNRTKRLNTLTAKRNRKIKDYMHKASRKIVDMAVSSCVGLIVIGANHGWKQEVHMGNVTNQNFVSIPYKTLINMIEYKARLEGIEVKTVRESYTSGTSYLDGEKPTREYYDKERREERGLFRSNNGILINADVNAAYQMMKLGDTRAIPIKTGEQIIKIKAA